MGELNLSKCIQGRTGRGRLKKGYKYFTYIELIYA